MKNIEKNFGKKVLVTDKHVRWDCERSLDNDEMLKYVFVVSGERRDREKNLKSILESLQKYGGSIEHIREDSGKVEGTIFHYDLKIMNSRTAPEMIEWRNLSIPNVRDTNLYERIKKGCSIENYVADLYAKD